MMNLLMEFVRANLDTRAVPVLLLPRTAIEATPARSWQLTKAASALPNHR